MFSAMKWKFIAKNHRFDESSVSTNLAPSSYCKMIAKGKSKSLLNDYSNEYIVGCDTIVFYNNEIIGKPKNKANAKNILEKLSDNIHYVYTGVSIINKKEKINMNFFSKTKVHFWKLDNNIIDNYLNQNTFFDKAGAYSIQGTSKLFVKSINGCHENVLGFPLSLFYKKINTIGLNLI